MRRLNNMSELVLKDGGEGLIMRLPASPYISGRSSALFKIKVGLPLVNKLNSSDKEGNMKDSYILIFIDRLREQIRKHWWLRYRTTT